MQPDEMQVYIANLGKYNEGELVGAWFHFPLDFDAIKEQIGLNNEHEEYAIHDYEMPVKISEYTSINELNQIYETVKNMADTPVFPAIQELVNAWFTDIEDLADHIDDILHYDVSSMEELATELVENGEFLGELSDTAKLYLDYNAIARDLEINGNYLITNHRIFEYVS